MYPPPGGHTSDDQPGQPWGDAQNQGGYPQQGTYPPAPPKRSRTPIVISIIAGVLVLCCGAAGVVGFLVKDQDGPARSQGATATPTGKSTPTPTNSPSEHEVSGDLDRFHTGDCLTIDTNNNVKRATCTDTGAYKVMLRKDGTTDDSVCADTGATKSLYQNGLGTAKDFILCIGPAT